MPTIKRAVRIYQIPEQVTSNDERRFLEELQNCSEAERPRFVLDCSRVWNMDIPTIHLLLSCLEEVMKCNGDVRLAALRPSAEEMLRQVGVNRLFEMYVSAESAVQSFHMRPGSIAPMEFEAEAFDRDSGLAA